MFMDVYSNVILTMGYWLYIVMLYNNVNHGYIMVIYGYIYIVNGNYPIMVNG